MSGSDRGLELLVGMTVMMLRSTNGAVFSLFLLGLLVITKLGFILIGWHKIFRVLFVILASSIVNEIFGQNRWVDVNVPFLTTPT